MTDFNIKETLSGRGFKAPAVAQYILDHHLEKELIEFALNDEDHTGWRGMWIVDHCSVIDPKRIKPFYIKLINNLKRDKLHDSAIRCTLRIFQSEAVPKKQESFLLDKCYSYLKNPSWAIAIRTFSMTVIYNISKPYPELVEELKQTLLQLLPSEEDAAIKSRIKNTLKEIEKARIKSKD